MMPPVGPVQTAQPPKRPLKIFSVDPMLERMAGNRVSIQIENESVTPGPVGSRVAVIDYDGGTNRFYAPVDLNEQNILIQGGLEPSESDPRFHQQMVYAVALKTLENFDRALGRRITLFKKNRPVLRILPHAFNGANAFYDPGLHALLFGYFRADADDPGPNLPGQTIYSCLSHDIIVHEMTHAVVSRLRKYFIEPTNMDVPAFHEGFSDIVALFQHFTYSELLEDQIQRTHVDLRHDNYLVQLAGQFGYALGAGKALRSALGDPNRVLYRSLTEPHARGSILVAAVFDAFFRTYQNRTRDLLRIATSGTGILPAGDLHPDLIKRVAVEASKAAQSILTMCIRAFDYLPPVDVSFGDYLRALVTADCELTPDDEFGQRSAMIESFRQRGIYPEEINSLAEESLLWAPADPFLPKIPAEKMEFLPELLFAATSFSKRATPWSPSAQQLEPDMMRFLSEDSQGRERYMSTMMATALETFARLNAPALRLDPALDIEVAGFHPVFRVAPEGRLLIELVAQFVQSSGDQDPTLGGLTLRGGTTLIASADGTIRYVISKPLPSSSLSPTDRDEASYRRDRLRAYVDLCDAIDASSAYADPVAYANRMLLRMNLSALHRGQFG